MDLCWSRCVGQVAAFSLRTAVTCGGMITGMSPTRAAMVAKHYELIFLKRAVSERRAANEYSLPAEQSAAMDFLNSNMRLPADDGCYWPGWKEIETEVAATWGDAIAALAADPSAELPR